MYRAVTEQIEVTVEPLYLEKHSDPDHSRFAWAYRITIRNGSERTVQLQERRWSITDANGVVEEVHGPGVVGKQPILHAGESFQYSSGCPLSTPSGFMVGSYRMIADDGRMFDVAIPAFSLDIPDETRTVN